MPNPLVSVIIPVYNAARFLPDAVASVIVFCELRYSSTGCGSSFATDPSDISSTCPDY